MGLGVMDLRAMAVVARAAPIVVGVVVLLAGVLQFTAWKAHHLPCSRMAGLGGTIVSTYCRPARQSTS